jgi:deoxyribose-phosphate aldolase
MVPIGYPIGGQTLKKRLCDMDYVVKHRSDQCCVTINYPAALSGRYDIVESECRAMHTEFDAALHIIDIVPATLFSAKELIAVGQAIAAGGGYHLKVNPGYGLGSTFEELSLLKRVFGEQFILDPSGGIRELKDVAEYVRRGFTVIHSQKTFPFIEEFRVLKERGGHLNV